MSFSVNLDNLGHTVSVEMLQQQHLIELDATMGRPGPRGERGPVGPSAGETFTTARSLKGWWPLQRALESGTGVVAWMGDSKSEGTGVERADQRSMDRFRTMLRDRWALPADTGVGYVPAYYDTFYDLTPEPTIEGPHVTVGYEGGLGNRSVHLQGNAVVTWPAMTYSAAVGVPVHWTRMESNGSLEVLIDGTLAATIDTQGSPRASMRTVVPITDGSHVVAVRHKEGTPDARVEGIVNESAPTGVKVHDASRSGGTLHQFTEMPGSHEQAKRHWEAMALLQPDLIVAAFGANDMASYTPQQWAASLEALLALRDEYAKDAGVLVLHGAQRVEDDPERLRQYEQAALEVLADRPRVSVLWESALWQPRPDHTYSGMTTDPDGWLADTVHLTADAHEAIAEYLLGSLAQGMPAAKGDPGDPAMSPHADTHATGGSDPITPESIGAPDVEQVSGTVDSGGSSISFGPGQAVSNGAAVETAITVANTAYTNALAAAPKEHAANHATGGSDPVAPADIGAYPASGSTYTGHVGSLREPGAYRVSGSAMNTGNGYPWTPDAVGYVIVHRLSPTYVTQEVISENGTVWRRNSVAGSTTSWRTWTPIAVDTGWRVLPLENGWAGTLKVRWVNGQVYVTVQNLNGSAATNSNLTNSLGGSAAFHAGVNNPAMGIGHVTSSASAPSGNVIGSIGMTGGSQNQILRASSPTSGWTNGAASLSFAAMSTTLPATLPGTPAPA